MELTGEVAHREDNSAAAGMAGVASGPEEGAGEEVDAVAGEVEGVESGVVDKVASGDGPATSGTIKADPQTR